MFQGHLSCEGWREESSRVLEQRPKMHGHHTSSGVCLEHGDSVPMCASLDGVCVLQWGDDIARWPVVQGLEGHVGEPWFVSFSWLVANGVPSMGVIWSNLFMFISNRAAAFWTACSRFRAEDGRPARRLLQKSSREVMREWIRISAAAWVRKGLIAATLRSWKYAVWQIWEMCLSIFIDLSK